VVAWSRVCTSLELGFREDDECLYGCCVFLGRPSMVGLLLRFLCAALSYGIRI
jgi:hypothetical protein